MYTCSGAREGVNGGGGACHIPHDAPRRRVHPVHEIQGCELESHGCVYYIRHLYPYCESSIDTFITYVPFVRIQCTQQKRLSHGILCVSLVTEPGCGPALDQIIPSTCITATSTCMEHGDVYVVVLPCACVCSCVFVCVTNTIVLPGSKDGSFQFSQNMSQNLLPFLASSSFLACLCQIDPRIIVAMPKDSHITPILSVRHATSNMLISPIFCYGWGYLRHQSMHYLHVYFSSIYVVYVCLISHMEPRCDSAPFQTMQESYPTILLLLPSELLPVNSLRPWLFTPGEFLVPRHIILF